MVKRDNVKSLAQLRQRKQELKLEMEVTKREMAHSMGVMRTDLRSFLVKKVALPVGGGVLGIYLLKKLLSGKRRPVVEPVGEAKEQKVQPVYVEPKSSSSVNFAQIVKIAVPIIQAALGFFAGYSKKEDEVEDE